MEKWEVLIADWPDREDLVAEIFYAREQWAVVMHEGDAWLVEIYPRRGGGSWHFELEQAIGMLVKAKQRLVDIDTVPGFNLGQSDEGLEPG